MDSHDELPATRMSLLRALKEEAVEQKLIALGIFYERYRRGLLSVLVQRYRVDPHDADDILHDFLCERMTDARLINSYLECLEDPASRQRKFRPYLVRSVLNFTIDQLRKKKCVANLQALHLDQVLEAEFSDLFVVEWVQELLTTALHRLRRHYLDTGKESHWLLFLARWVEPLILGWTPPSYKELAGRFQLENAKEVGNVLTNALRMFRQKWREVLLDEVVDGDSEAFLDVLNDAKASLHMAKYLDFSQALMHIVHASPAGNESRSGASGSENGCHELFDLAMEGCTQLLPIEEALLFKSYLATSLRELFPGESHSGTEADLSGMCLRDVLCQDGLSGETIRLVVQDLKEAVRNRNSTDMPVQFAGAARLALIAVADKRGNHNMTKVPKTQLLAAMSSVVAEPWLDDGCRTVISECLKRNGCRLP